MGDSDEDSLNGAQFSRDEVEEIKRATRLAQARHFAVQQQRPTLQSTRRGGAGLPTAPSSSSAPSSSLLEQNLVRQLEESKRLRAALEEEVKECRFEMKQMQSRLALLQSSEKALEERVSSESVHVKLACEVAERTLEDMRRLVQAECDRLIRLVSGIERHTMHGHHAVASRTTVSLLLKTRHGLENLKRVVFESTDVAPSSSLPASFAPPSTSGSSMAAISQAPSGLQQQHNHQVKSDALDGALLEMCKHLEDENTRLESALAVAQADVEEAQRESSASRLIPHYRLAIVRARAQASTLAQQLEREQVRLPLALARLELPPSLILLLAPPPAHPHPHEQDNNRVLREQLEDVLRQMRGGLPRDLKHSAIFDFLAVKAGGDAAKSHPTVAPMSSLAMLSNPAATDQQAKIVQRDLAKLDAEIADLQSKLEMASLAKTKEKLSAASAGSDDGHQPT